MRKASRLFLALAVVFLFLTPLLAQMPNGEHFNLNIIGVEKAKKVDMTDSSRHTIFVPLRTGGTLGAKIYLVPGDFTVCDGNAFDGATNCGGEQIAAEGAVFALPCNTNPDITYTDTYGCPADPAIPKASYAVWARALGKPGGKADMMTCATDPSGELECATENVLNLERLKGKSPWMPATSQLSTLVADIDEDGELETVALFANGFQDFFWSYANNGLRLAQIRFYPLD
jgi:hypothetical protein